VGRSGKASKVPSWGVDVIPKLFDVERFAGADWATSAALSLSGMLLSADEWFLEGVGFGLIEVEEGVDEELKLELSMAFDLYNLIGRGACNACIFGLIISCCSIVEISRYGQSSLMQEQLGKVGEDQAYYKAGGKRKIRDTTHHPVTTATH